MSFLSKLQRRYESTSANANQLHHAKHGVEGIGFYDIPIDAFLDLTTKNDQEKQAILQEAKKPPKPEWETSIIHPFLYVNEDGKITGHEGRHRAASAFHQGEKRFRIVIAAQDSGWDHTKWGWRWKRQLHVPPELHGQYRPVTHKVDLSYFVKIIR